ncbi:efflux RND transporter periplasmic adaptor subunit [Rapidithrix thailandica]|uniref:Efflux RND transporter periplasmic adaptor subunit n=1 Tax=Rapidithrix thailandica TaxID=413964 RepID=A0AAW9RY59_9BACT
MNYYCHSLLFLVLWGCTHQAEELKDDPNKKTYLKEQNLVVIQMLKEQDFQKELVSNGKLRALRKSDLNFALNEPIELLPVKNGMQVRKGSIIVQLRQTKQKQDLERAQMNLQKARLELADFLIGQGYDLKDSSNVPMELMEIARIRSGYAEAQQSLNDAREAYQGTVLTAPFAGKIANLQAKLYERPNSGETPAFCTLIDDSEFEVEFQIIEAEIKDIRLKQHVKIQPFSLDQTFKGQVTEINPVVDENGLVSVKARVRNTGGLLEGMNVKVMIENQVNKQLVVPKSAVVLRQNQEVIFSIKEGKAYWNYVQTVFENSHSYAIIPHPEKNSPLQAGDTVIISGNLNLAHESQVKISETGNSHQ